VPTANESAPLQSLLTPWNMGSPETFWHAPVGVHSVEFCIALVTPAFVSGVVFIIDICGHTNLDIPIVRMPHFNLVFVIGLGRVLSKP
jgi:hypothetical protein